MRGEDFPGPIFTRKWHQAWSERVGDPKTFLPFFLLV